MSNVRKTAVGIALSGVALILWGLGTPALAELSVTRHTVDGGGHSGTAGPELSLGGTCGQSDAGTVSGGRYELRAGFWHGGRAISGVGDPEGGEFEDAGAPTAFRVVLGLQNPFSVETRIQLDLPLPRAVDVRVFDFAGRLVDRVHRGSLPAGQHFLSWEGTTDHGGRAPSGTYLIRVQAGDYVATKRVVYLR